MVCEGQHVVVSRCIEFIVCSVFKKRQQHSKLPQNLKTGERSQDIWILEQQPILISNFENRHLLYVHRHEQTQ